jgi:hypothetical protein
MGPSDIPIFHPTLSIFTPLEDDTSLYFGLKTIFFYPILFQCYFGIYHGTILMKYIDCYNILKGIFNLSDDVIHLPDSNMMIRNFDFISDGMNEESGPPESIEKNLIAENYRFRYPVLIPNREAYPKKAIIYLHGLNERNWLKHLPGAMLLAEKTGNPVILFPLSFHINRGMPEWTDIRKMAQPLELRRQTYSQLQEASVLNLPLSERLTERPIRFFTSGYQSARDLLKLKKQIYEGLHPVFVKGTGADIFAYSISCLMMQVLMLSDPQEFLPDSKIVFFAGGSLFSDMNGISKFIMDNVAFARIWEYYGEIISKSCKSVAQKSWFENNRFGRAFTRMLGYGRFDSERVKSFQPYYSNLMVVALKNDQVIPLKGIRRSFGEMFSRSANIHVVDFPYPYIHENPFPVLNRKIDHEVDYAFQSVYLPVAGFFNKIQPTLSLNRKIDQKTTSFPW